MEYYIVTDLESLKLDLNKYLSLTFEINHFINQDETIIKALELDSLDLLDLVVAIEERYNVKIESDHIDSLKTINDLYTYIFNNIKN